METTIYTDGTYLRNNPAWHADDSAWKARHIAAILARHGIEPATLCEVGCGAGEILRELSTTMPYTSFTGYEVSPNAYSLCSRKEGGRLTFRLANLLERSEQFEVALAIDVMEHVEDCFDFL